jgi:hypothetical protein
MARSRGSNDDMTDYLSLGPVVCCVGFILGRCFLVAAMPDSHTPPFGTVQRGCPSSRPGWCAAPSQKQSLQLCVCGGAESQVEQVPVGIPGHQNS